RNAFADFNPEKVARFTEHDVERLMKDTGIIRNRLKILAAIGNARVFLDIQRESGSFSNYIWGFLPARKPIVNNWKTLSEVPARRERPGGGSADPNKRGLQFFGTMTCSAHKQATGMVNVDLVDCGVRGSAGLYGEMQEE